MSQLFAQEIGWQPFSPRRSKPIKNRKCANHNTQFSNLISDWQFPQKHNNQFATQVLIGRE